MEILIMIAQFLLGLSIIVGLHELGHLLFAKLFGMRVESYIIGFPPKLLRFKWGETEYALGAVPLGGAVKITGMIDESLDTEQLGSTPQPWEFRAKPAWQRLLVMLGGIIFNIITGIVIFIGLALATGDRYLPKAALNQHGIVPNAVGRDLGFEEGDQIINISGHDFEKFSDLTKPSTLLAGNCYYTVLRDGQELRIDIPDSFMEQLSSSKQSGSFIEARAPFAIKSVLQNSGAAHAGLQPGDRIVAIADTPTPYFNQLKHILDTHAGQEVTIQYKRGETIYRTQAQVSAEGKLGFVPTTLLAYKEQKYTLLQAIPLGTSKAFDVLYVNLIGLRKIISGKVSASQSLQGPIGIAQIFGRHFDWIKFWTIVGLLSMVLAMTNLLPIPALDGGHTMFILYEIITGRRLSERFLEVTQKIGMTILLLLMGYVIINDLYKLF